ncbi:MAG: PAS domain-containing sensor histidine kinase [Alphaproteobacteria bacterium]|nr:PAS domain-containing sensor histidine kinase [Alphaproteobacteria bacterium]
MPFSPQSDPDILFAVSDACDIGILLLNERGDVVFWNQWLERASGIVRKDIVGRSLTDVWPGVRNPRFDHAVRDVFERRLSAILSPRLHGSLFPLSSIKGANTSAPGTMIQLISVSPLSTDLSAPYCLVQINDVTAAINRENSLREKNRDLTLKTQELERALESEKNYTALQAKLVALISHEFRTPLAIIDGGAQRIARQGGQESREKLIERSTKIRFAVSRLVELIDTILLSSRIEEHGVPFNPERFRLREDLMSMCRQQAEISPDHEIVADLDGLPDVIEGDPKLLRHVFQNLLSNAVKYSPKARNVEIDGVTRGRFAVVTVRDFGVGIPTDEIPNMFRRFYRARTAEGIPGTGIGLNVCKEFVDMHGGAISVESAEGEGSTFTVSLPIENL